MGSNKSRQSYEVIGERTRGMAVCAEMTRPSAYNGVHARQVRVACAVARCAAVAGGQ